MIKIKVASIVLNIVLVFALIAGGIAYMDLRFQKDAEHQKVVLATRQWGNSVLALKVAVQGWEASKQDYYKLQQICNPQQLEKLTGLIYAEE
jgi:hypothetical protein